MHFIKKLRKACFICLLLVLAVTVGPRIGASNLDYVKERAADTWRSNGFEVHGYQGYTMWITLGTKQQYGGAHVWYTLRRIPDNGVTYQGFLERWGDEVHVYNIKALDAIQPR